MRTMESSAARGTRPNPTQAGTRISNGTPMTSPLGPTAKIRKIFPSMLPGETIASQGMVAIEVGAPLPRQKTNPAGDSVTEDTYGITSPYGCSTACSRLRIRSSVLNTSKMGGVSPALISARRRITPGRVHNHAPNKARAKADKPKVKKSIHNADAARGST